MKAPYKDLYFLVVSEHQKKLQEIKDEKMIKIKVYLIVIYE